MVPPSDTNAHPHLNTEETIVVVHNGIIENYIKLKKKLEGRGYQFVSETDTEVIAHLWIIITREIHWKQ